jgi:hypothetical protein
VPKPSAIALEIEVLGVVDRGVTTAVRERRLSQDVIHRQILLTYGHNFAVYLLRELTWVVISAAVAIAKSDSGCSGESVGLGR